MANLFLFGFLLFCMTTLLQLGVCNNYEITEINYINELKLYYSNDIKIQDIQ